MTLGPGVLFFHKLKSFEILKQPIISAQEYIEDKIDESRSMTINAFQIVKIPFVQDFFFELSLPTLYLVFFVLFYLKIAKFPEPSPKLLSLCFMLLSISCLKLMNQEKKRNYLISIFSSLIFGSIMPLIIYSGKIQYFQVINDDSFKFFTFYCLYASFMFSISPMTNGVNYYKYRHPKLDLLHFTGFRSILLTIYSTLSTVLISIWHYFDVIFVIITIIAINLFEMRICVKLIIAGCIIYAILAVFATKRILQFSVMSLLLPFFRVSKKNEEMPKLKILLRPLGASVFGMMCLPVAQLLLCIALAQSEFFHENTNAWEVPFYTALLINGEIIQATQILVALCATFKIINV